MIKCDIMNRFEIDPKEWISLLPVIQIAFYGYVEGDHDYYCHLSEECQKNNLEKHDYRYKILSVEIFETIV